MPITAGNLFLGTFDVRGALTNPLTATRSGVPFERVPVLLRGWYKYRPGETFYEPDKTAADRLRPVPGRQDCFDICAVHYESTDGMRTLDGHADRDVRRQNLRAENRRHSVGCED